MTKTEQQILSQLGQALIARAETDEKIVQLRAMLQAVRAVEKERADAAAQQEPEA